MAERWFWFELKLLYKIQLLRDLTRVPGSIQLDLWRYQTHEEAAVGQKTIDLGQQVPACWGIAD